MNKKQLETTQTCQCRKSWRSVTDIPIKSGKITIIFLVDRLIPYSSPSVVDYSLIPNLQRGLVFRHILATFIAAEVVG